MIYRSAQTLMVCMLVAACLDSPDSLVNQPLAEGTLGGDDCSGCLTEFPAGSDCNSACASVGYPAGGYCAVPGSTNPARCCSCYAEQPPANDCSGCLTDFPAGSDCNSACALEGYPKGGYCAVPGSTNPAACCSCYADQPPANDCSGCLTDFPAGSDCNSACKLEGYPKGGYCAVPGSTNPAACCSCYADQPPANDCSGCLTDFPAGSDCNSACKLEGYPKGGYCAVPGSTNPAACCSCYAPNDCDGCIGDYEDCEAVCQGELGSQYHGHCAFPRSTQAGSCCTCAPLQNAIGVDPIGHLMTYRGEPLLLVGDSGTQCVMQNAHLDHRRWIDDCAANDIRAVHIWSFIPPRQKSNGSVVEDRWGYVYPGLTPWARRTSGENAYDGKRRWDLTKFDEGPDGDIDHYWPRLRDLCSYAQARGIVVGITVFFGWPKFEDDFRYHPFNARNGGFLSDDDNEDVAVIASPGVEVWPQSFNGASSESTKTQWVWERFAKKLIDETSAYDNVLFVFMDEHSYSEGNCGDHFRDFFRERGQFWIDWNARRGSVDGVVAKLTRDHDKYGDTMRKLVQTPNRPFFTFESRPYAGDGLRVSIWTTAMAGGHYFFHADERQEHVRMGIMGYDPHVRVPSGQGDDRYGSTKRRWLGYASRFFNKRVVDLSSLKPHNELVSTGYCLANPGHEYVVYVKPGGSSPTVNLAAAKGTLDFDFYDPRDGYPQNGGTVAGGGSRGFSRPSSNDWILHITARP